jgi:molybdopterin-guanine dinucleotide biosynthesis protein B
MKRLHLIGRKNHGKTTLVVELVEELTRRGVVVGTIKHTHHQHELDVQGKDSHRHRSAGAAAVGVLSRGLNAIFIPVQESDDPDVDRYAVFAPTFAACDLVLIEGDSQTDSPKIEVWRSEVSDTPLAESDSSIRAIVTDDPINIETPILARSDLSGLADWVLNNAK